MYDSIKDIVIQSVIKKGRGVFHFIDNFVRFGNNESVRKALQSLVKEGKLLRIANGIYYYPKIDKDLGLGVLYPSKEAVAIAVAKHSNVKIVPTGAYALHALGLTTQMQTMVVFLTNGRSKQIDLGDNRVIKFLHSSSQKMFNYKSYVMILAIQALLELGEDQITEIVKTVIKNKLQQVKESDFYHDLTIAPVWAQKILKEL